MLSCSQPSSTMCDIFDNESLYNRQALQRQCLLMRLLLKWLLLKSNLSLISFYLFLNTNNKLISSIKSHLKMSPMKPIVSKIQVLFHQINFLKEMLKKMILVLSILNELSSAILLSFRRDI